MFGSEIAESNRVRRSGSIGLAVLTLGGQHRLRAVDGHLAAIDLRQEIVDAGGDDVDDAGLSRLGRRHGGGLAHRLLGELGVTAAQLREAAQQRDHIVDRLALCRGLSLVAVRALLVFGRLVASWLRQAGQAADLDRCRGAKVGARRHRRDMGGVDQERAGGRCPRAAWRHIDDDRDRRSDHQLDQFAGRTHEPARRIKPHDQRAGLFGLGLFDRARKLAHRSNPDRTGDFGEEDRMAVLRGGGSSESAKQCHGQEQSRAQPQPDRHLCRDSQRLGHVASRKSERAAGC